MHWWRPRIRPRGLRLLAGPAAILAFAFYAALCELDTCSLGWALMRAIESRNHGAVASLLKHGADPNYQTIRLFDFPRRSPLALARYMSDHTSEGLLLAAGTQDPR